MFQQFSTILVFFILFFYKIQQNQCTTNPVYKKLILCVDYVKFINILLNNLRNLFLRMFYDRFSLP